MSDPKPNSYPRHDAAEVNSVNLVSTLLDASVVKSDFGKRDKFPNIDGFVELIEREGEKEIPAGKMDVQIKTLPAGELQYQCPAELIAYGETTTLPVLLICADYQSRKAYWKHIHRGMPEYKPNQDSFVVKFDSAVDVIDERNVFLNRWHKIVAEHRRRHQEGSLLKQAMQGELGMAGLTRVQVTKLQKFSDRLNGMLDGELRFVKDLQFPGAWKLGVAATEIGDRWFSYHLFSIPFGSSSPLIINLSGRAADDVIESVRAGKPDPLGLAVYGEQKFESSRSMMSVAGIDPIVAATTNVLNYVRTAVEKREMPVSGRVVATEVLFHFIERHGHAMGLAEGDRYSVTAINYGLNVYMPAWLRLAFEKFDEGNKIGSLNSNFWPDLLNLTAMPTIRPANEKVRARIDSGKKAGPLPIRGDYSELRMVVEAVELLTSEGITEIARPYSRRSCEAVYIWNGFPLEEAERRLKIVVENALPEYRALLDRLKFRPTVSTYLGRTDRFYRIRYEPHQQNEPFVEAIAFEGTAGEPLMRVAEWKEDDRHAVMDGMTRALTRTGWRSGSGLFSPTPVLDAVYEMFRSDLVATYPNLRFKQPPKGFI